MKTALAYRFGPPDVIQIQEVEKPSPGDGQVLVKVNAASINASDYRTRQGKPLILRLVMGSFTQRKNPRLGSDVSGSVEAVGENVSHFKPGDEVFGYAKGSFAEFALAKESNLTPKPANASHQQAAAVPVAALTALQGIRHAGGIRPGQQVLVQGASGGVGTFMVQLAKAYGGEVTAVVSPRNLEMARSIGADHVIDYTRQDFTRSPQRYDLIIAVNGYHSLAAYKRALNPQGVYVCAGGSLPQIFQAMLLGSWISEKRGKKLSSMGIAKVVEEDLSQLADLLGDGKIVPLIDRTYVLDEIVEASRYVEQTHPQGKVVITV